MIWLLRCTFLISLFGAAILMVVCAILVGAVWAVIPAIFKAFFKTNESLFTLMMNYIATCLVSVMITVWYPKGSGSVARIKDYALPEVINDVIAKTLLADEFSVKIVKVFPYDAFPTTIAGGQFNE
jgi:simple sugar transport system permease protein